MNILLINHYAGSPRHGMEYRPFYLSREWVKQGHQVTIVSASFSHVRTKMPHVVGSYSEERIEGVRYIWLRTPRYSGNGIGRVVNMFAFVFGLFRMTRFLCSEVRPDAVIASSTYPLDVFPANRIAKKACAKFLYEVHDLWPLSPMELGGMSRFHPFIMLLQWAENVGYRKADKVVSMLPKAESHMKEHGMAAGKFVFVPNGVVTEEWDSVNSSMPETHVRLLTKLRDASRFVVLYAGAHGLANALDTVLDAATMMKEETVSFVLVGDGPEKRRLENRIREMNLNNVHFLPSVSRNCVPALLGYADALYIGLKAEPLFRFGVSPNKLMDYMMAGKPIIHAIEAGNDIVAESRCGISVPPEDPGALCNALSELRSLSANDLQLMGNRGKEYVREHHDYKVLARQFADVMGSLRGTKPKAREIHEPSLSPQVMESA